MDTTLMSAVGTPDDREIRSMPYFQRCAPALGALYLLCVAGFLVALVQCKRFLRFISETESFVLFHRLSSFRY